MKSIVRRLRAGLADEGGFSLVEMMVSLFVMGLAMAGLARLTGSMLLETADNRQREVAVALSNELMEEIRSNGYDNVKMKSGPGTYEEDGTVHKTIKDPTCDACFDHLRTIEEGNYTFEVYTVVFGIDDDADGTGASDADGITVDYKRVVIEIHATSGPEFEYKSDTIVHDTSHGPIVAVQGIRVEIRDPNNSGKIVADAGYVWEITITGTDVVGDEVEEGIYENFALEAGAYTCTLSNTPSTQGWHPQGTSADTETFSCLVSEGSVTTIERYWEQEQACEYTPGQSGRLWVRVQDGSMDPIAGALVDPDPAAGQGSDPVAQPTDLNGDASFNGIETGPYDVTAIAVGYDPSPTLRTCVTSTDPESPQLTITLNATSLEDVATVEITVKSKKDGVWTIKAALEGGPELYEQQSDFEKDEVKTFTFNPVYGTYDVRIYCFKKDDWDKKKEKKKQTFDRASPPYAYDWDIKC